LHRNRLETLSNLLEARPVYSEESVDAILVVLKSSEVVTEDQVKDAVRALHTAFELEKA